MRYSKKAETRKEDMPLSDLRKFRLEVITRYPEMRAKLKLVECAGSSVGLSVQKKGLLN